MIYEQENMAKIEYTTVEDDERIICTECLATYPLNTYICSKCGCKRLTYLRDDHVGTQY